LLWPVLLGTFAAACAIERGIEREGGVHPPGFAGEQDPQFHGTALREAGYPLADCRVCHGDDYAGGPVGFSCNQALCHTQGVEWCGTCHDGKSPPEPATGAHAAHPFGCDDCHLVPASARENRHTNGEVEVQMNGLAGAQAFEPTWSADQRRCQNTYCHGAESPVWDTPTGTLECESCHATPPDNHARFPLAPAPEGCTPCHPVPGDPDHLDGAIQILEPSCSQCHGKTEDGAPPPALDGSTTPSSRGVGAHVRHLDANLSDRIGRAAECEDCHDIPSSMRADGHLDDSAPADVRFSGGDYDPETGSCVVGCHWDRDPGPVWTDTTGQETACDACHAFPPLKTRAGTPHPAVDASLSTCQLCHQFDVSTHVDGHGDLL
jgi:predicted CxxxxCH...CXXCH cytochrome family protein